ncbi:hypothetical protein HDE_03998 [Halotydeus destructor]|nr:hypothetical protein HDE_03998 [Halotydeus destructor]
MVSPLFLTLILGFCSVATLATEHEILFPSDEIDVPRRRFGTGLRDGAYLSLNGGKLSCRANITRPEKYLPAEPEPTRYNPFAEHLKNSRSIFHFKIFDIQFNASGTIDVAGTQILIPMKPVEMPEATIEALFVGSDLTTLEWAWIPDVPALVEVTFLEPSSPWSRLNHECSFIVSNQLRAGLRRVLSSEKVLQKLSSLIA